MKPVKSMFLRWVIFCLLSILAFELLLLLAGCIEAPQDRREREEMPQRMKDLERQLDCIQVPATCPKEAR